MSQFVIVIDLPDRTHDGVRTDPTQKLRQLLKIAARAFGARCISVTDCSPLMPANASNPHPGAGNHARKFTEGEDPD